MPVAVPRVGGTTQAAFAFRDAAEVLTSPGGVDVKIVDEAGNEESIDDTDVRVTIGTTLAEANRDRLGITAAENTAGTGLVTVNVTPDNPGWWTVFCDATSTVDGSAAVKFKVYAETEV